MKERLLVGAMRILLAVVVLAGSIVTFNFGLNERFNPTNIVCWGIICDRGYPDVSFLRPIAPGEAVALLLFCAGMFIFWRNITGGGTDRRKKKNLEIILTYQSLNLRPRRINTSSTRQLHASKAMVRPYKKTRL
jgi:hypothetical protein